MAPSRPIFAAVVLFASLLPGAPALSQARDGLQPSPTAQPLPSQQQLPSANQLRSQFNRGCVGQNNTPQQAGYCGCAFDSLLRRYTVQQYVAMDALIIRGGPGVGRFAGVAWDPEFSACRRRFPAQGR